MKEILTVTEAKKIFDEANKNYFNGELEPIEICSMSCSNKVGGYSFLKEKGKIKRRVIFISTVYKMERKDFPNVVVHEMIHYYLHIKYGKPMGHGKVWQEMANAFNEKYGLNIKKRPDSSTYEYIGNDESVIQWLFKKLFRKRN